MRAVVAGLSRAAARFGPISRRQDPTAEKAMHLVFVHIHRFYSFEGLHAFNAKFGPERSPRYSSIRENGFR